MEVGTAGRKTLSMPGVVEGTVRSGWSREGRSEEQDVREARWMAWLCRAKQTVVRTLAFSLKWGAVAGFQTRHWLDHT